MLMTPWWLILWPRVAPRGLGAKAPIGFRANFATGTASGLAPYPYRQLRGRKPSYDRTQLGIFGSCSRPSDNTRECERGSGDPSRHDRSRPSRYRGRQNSPSFGLLFHILADRIGLRGRAPAHYPMLKNQHRLDYDFCVPTGDCRGRTHGDCGSCLEGVSRLREALRGDIYAVLGNHDSITMVPDPEALGIRMLLNECVAIDRRSIDIGHRRDRRILFAWRGQ